ncbi:hypothetical protein H4Q26_010600 [Puccinia striiformis f. sp. tritici PST-130]|nr:hypothetical protein H4Q26_010600 [Puccinia striiformis f. sp. tritici PST-130]
MLARDVQAFQNMTTINVHEAKTAKPGEIQIIKLRPINSPLCPVKAIERRRQATSTDTDSLFGYNGPKGRVNLTKRRVNQILAAAWNDLGVDADEIKSLGRWTTDCYKRYIKPISRKQVIASLSLLELQTF